MSLGEVLDVVGEMRIRGLATVVEHAGRTASSSGVEVAAVLRSVAEMVRREYGADVAPMTDVAADLEVRARNAAEGGEWAAEALRRGRESLAAAEDAAASGLHRSAPR